jgi:flagellar hook-associated protein FlgK
VADELAAAERELRPHITLAMQEPRVAEAFEELQDSLTATMTRIDPNSAASIERLNELAEQMRQIEIEIVKLEGGG